MHFFYGSGLGARSKRFTFDAIESHHLSKVLRKKNGDIIFLTNGKGLLFESHLEKVSPRKCSAHITKYTPVNRTRTYKLHIAIAPTKSMQRMEWFVEKATEIGIDTISFILCKHSERKNIKIERLEKIAIAAMKQSLQCFLPLLNPLQSFEQFIASPLQAEKYIAHCSTGEKTNFKAAFTSKQNYCVLIGAEGDFSQQEIYLAKQKGFQSLALTQQRLRSETAAIFVCNHCLSSQV